MKRYFIFIILFLAAVINSYSYAAESMEKHHQGMDKESSELSGKIENGIRIIKVKASRYKFEPDPIVVKLGEKVRLLLTSTDVAHGLTIPDFRVDLTVDAKKTGRIEFIADKKGIFNAHCSVYCGPGHGHMHANFIVK